MTWIYKLLIRPHTLRRKLRNFQIAQNFTDYQKYINQNTQWDQCKKMSNTKYGKMHCYKVTEKLFVKNLLDFVEILHKQAWEKGNYSFEYISTQKNRY